MISFPELHFIDLEGKLTKSINTIFEKHNINSYINYQTQTINIKEYQNDSNTIFVSPANSLGFMDGGIDLVLSQFMFLEVEKKVKQSIKTLGLKNILDQYHLPVGSSLIVPVSNTNINNQYLISSPTMLLPQDVSQTDNAYYAFYAILKLVQKFNKYLVSINKPVIEKVVIPGLGTGIGKISALKHAEQLFMGIKHFIEYDLYHTKELTQDLKPLFEDQYNSSPFYYIRNPEFILRKQPRYYQNTAFFPISADKIVISKLNN